jgi:hypothetical protein
MWPSEIKQAREALMAHRRNLSLRLVLQLESKLEQLPQTLAGVTQMQAVSIVYPNSIVSHRPCLGDG